MIAVAVVDVVGYVFAAVAIGGVSPTAGGFLALTLVWASWVWAWQARLPAPPRGAVRRRGSFSPRCRGSAGVGCAPGGPAPTGAPGGSPPASRAPMRSPAP